MVMLHDWDVSHFYCSDWRPHGYEHVWSDYSQWYSWFRHWYGWFIDDADHGLSGRSSSLVGLRQCLCYCWCGLLPGLCHRYVDHRGLFTLIDQFSFRSGHEWFHCTCLWIQWNALHHRLSLLLLCTTDVLSTQSTGPGWENRECRTFSIEQKRQILHLSFLLVINYEWKS